MIDRYAVLPSKLNQAEWSMRLLLNIYLKVTVGIDYFAVSLVYFKLASDRPGTSNKRLAFRF